MFALRLPEALEKRLDRLAKLTNRSKSYYARSAIEAYVEDLEDIYAVEKRLKKSSKTYTLAEMEKRLGLEDGVRRSSRKRAAKTRS